MLLHSLMRSNMSVSKAIGLVPHKNDNKFKKGANSSRLTPSIRSLLLFVVVFVRN